MFIIFIITLRYLLLLFSHKQGHIQDNALLDLFHDKDDDEDNVDDCSLVDDNLPGVSFLSPQIKKKKPPMSPVSVLFIMILGNVFSLLMF